MVSFTSITQGIFLVTIMILSASEAAPATAGSGKANSSSSSVAVAPHTNATAAAPFALPPIISSRTKPNPHPSFAGDLNAESSSIEKNKAWYKAHGGNLTDLSKRDTSTVGGMTMDLPSNSPPVTTSSGPSIVTASSSQVNTFKFYAGVASTAYCRGVVPLGGWTCNNCLKYVPDGKLLVTFSSLLADTNGFVLRSDSQKTIHLVFRGTNSIRSAITVNGYLVSNVFA